MNTLDPTSPGGAAEQLRTAQHLNRRFTTTAPVVLIGFGILCAAASAGVIALHLTQGARDERAGVMIFLLAWVAVAILVPFMFPQPFRRGLGKRWIAYMAGWGALWVTGTLVAETALLGLAFAIAALFLVLFVVAASLEARLVRTARAPDRQSPAGE